MSSDMQLQHYVNEMLIKKYNDQQKIILIDENGNNLGIQTVSQSLKMAKELELDLLEVSDNGDNPVCRLLNYSKFKYKHEKKIKQENASRRSRETIKTLMFGPTIEDRDLDMKIKNIIKFLSAKTKVKIIIKFSGRQIQYPEYAFNICNKIIDQTKHLSDIDQNPSLDSKSVSMSLLPHS